MPNGKPPKTTGEHLVSLYGYVQGFKRQIDHLHQDVGKLEKKTEIMGEELKQWIWERRTFLVFCFYGCVVILF